VLDEFDINLHPDILPFLIQLFTDKKLIKKMLSYYLQRTIQTYWTLWVNIEPF